MAIADNDDIGMFSEELNRWLAQSGTARVTERETALYRALRKLATAPEDMQRRVFDLMDAALPGPVTSEEQFDARVELLRLLMDAGVANAPPMF